MGYLMSVPVNAGADLSGSQYHAIQIAGTIATAPTNTLGILQNKPESGEDATAGWLGRSRFRAGGPVTAGNRLTVGAGGWLMAVGSNELGVGTALQTVNSGAIAEGIFNFAGAITEVISANLA